MNREVGGDLGRGRKNIQVGDRETFSFGIFPRYGRAMEQLRETSSPSPLEKKARKNNNVESFDDL